MLDRKPVTAAAGCALVVEILGSYLAFVSSHGLAGLLLLALGLVLWGAAERGMDPISYVTREFKEIRERVQGWDSPDGGGADAALLSEAALGADWNRPEEDAAWSDLRQR